ncbi:MAG: hypothetical protein EKK55_22600 [Rhodocyclaceae bacterium]|nr:MAG: hypothetical protein EKK55_22600 [Rhodocyclaceae bacterium]
MQLSDHRSATAPEMTDDHRFDYSDDRPAPNSAPLPELGRGFSGWGAEASDRSGRVEWHEEASGREVATVAGVDVRVRECDHARDGVIERRYIAEVRGFVGLRPVGRPQSSRAAAKRLATRMARATAGANR